MINQIGYQAYVCLCNRSIRYVALCVTVVFVSLCALMSYFVATGYSVGSIENVAYGYLYSFSGRVGYILPFVLGALIVTSEYRYSTLPRSAMFAKSRLNLYVSTNIVAVIFAAIAAVVLISLCFLVTGTIFSVAGSSARLTETTFWFMYLRIVCLYLEWALIGAGLGWICKSQALTIGIVLSFSIFVEPTLSAIANNDGKIMAFARWLPGPCNWSVSWPSTANFGDEATRQQIGLGWQQSLLIMLLYALIMLIAGYWLSVRKSDLR